MRNITFHVTGLNIHVYVFIRCVLLRSILIKWDVIEVEVEMEVERNIFGGKVKFSLPLQLPLVVLLQLTPATASDSDLFHNMTRMRMGMPGHSHPNRIQYVLM